tara:strand:- start:20 stop:277 length:258 start_codon:yes stop_codon:yes gene_type:complete
LKVVEHQKIQTKNKCDLSCDKDYITQHIFHHTIPKDPAVMPTATKNPNSKRSLEPGGIDVNSNARGIIEEQKINRLYMLLLLLLQ